MRNKPKTSPLGRSFAKKMKKVKLGLYKREVFCYNLNCSEEHTALWCSRLARQPVTLEVDGSSPFGVANKNTIR